MSHSSRSSTRFASVTVAGSRPVRHFQRPTNPGGSPVRSAEYFGCNTFSFDLMAQKLPARDVDFLREQATSAEPLSHELAEKVAVAVRDWALTRGATHYCHWFQPQTGATAEKHDSFLAFSDKGRPMELFTWKQLIQSEPDASSFPSGGMRSTFEARGYTAWDASSPMFLMETDNGLTLCIPSVFLSYSGEALDKKTPLLRSLKAVSRVATESLKLLGESDIRFVTTTAGPEQEYFVIDEALYNLRPDLILAGRTLLGARPPKGQQMEDHYFGSIKPRILAFMIECEHELCKLGVPCKTRHNEVAPCQFELAPIFEPANIAADHNQLIMEVLRTVARRHHLVVLFHEKPFADINGSGKHVNWALCDSKGHNLLEPGDAPHENLRFLYFLSATVKAIRDNGALLRMAIATAGNDFRLGANEAPPAIMSVFLGEALTEVLERLTDSGAPDMKKRDKTIDLDLAKVPAIVKDTTDRNRTSPFAFTGNKFEFRAVGSSASISAALTSLNAAVTAALTDMNERLRKRCAGRAAASADILAVIQEVTTESRGVRFEGNNYDVSWHREAESRGLPNLRTTPEALRVLKAESTHKVMAASGIHSPSESLARYHVRLERYCKIRLIEIEALFEMISTHVLPAAEAQQTLSAKAIQSVREATGKIGEAQVEDLRRLSSLTARMCSDRREIQDFLTDCSRIGEEELGDKLATKGMDILARVRETADTIETLVDDDLWSLPKYRELLYIL